MSDEDEMRERRRLAEGWSALRAACFRQHGGGPGGAAICACGRGGGGSTACTMLRTLRELIVYLPTEGLPDDYRRHVERLRSVIH